MVKLWRISQLQDNKWVSIALFNDENRAKQLLFTLNKSFIIPEHEYFMQSFEIESLDKMHEILKALPMNPEEL